MIEYVKIPPRCNKKWRILARDVLNSRMLKQRVKDLEFNTLDHKQQNNIRKHQKQTDNPPRNSLGLWKNLFGHLYHFVHLPFTAELCGKAHENALDWNWFEA